MEKFKVLKLSKEGLESSIAGLSQIKPILQKHCLIENLDGQGKQDAKELGEHFETAINAMITVLGFIEGNGDRPCKACGGSGHYKDGKCGACDGTGKES